jgi:hypothetical protein
MKAPPFFLLFLLKRVGDESCGRKYAFYRYRHRKKKQKNDIDAERVELNVLKRRYRKRYVFVAGEKTLEVLR